MGEAHGWRAIPRMRGWTPFASSFMMDEAHKHATIHGRIWGWNQPPPCLRPLVLGMPSPQGFAMWWVHSQNEWGWRYKLNYGLVLGPFFWECRHLYIKHPC
jgi:hypothetical protein